MARARSTDPHVAALREALARIEAAGRRENDVLEEVVDAAADDFRGLPEQERVPALLRAVGRSSGRRRHAVLLLCAVPDDPAAREVMRTYITDPDADVRSMVIQTIGAAEIEEFAPLIADRIANEDDAFCQDMAVFAAGRLRARVCLPAIFDLVATDFSRWRLAQVLARYATEDVEPYLRRWFEDADLDHNVRLQAAWGLGKLGEKGAVDYLAQCLVDRDDTDRFRCAQALCDINGWPFEWHIDHVERTAERIRSKRRSDAASPGY